MAKELTTEDVLKVIREDVEKTSLRKTATRLGCSAAYLSDVLRGNRQVGEDLAAQYGFNRTVKITKEVKFQRQ
jgi:hypothetical protein